MFAAPFPQLFSPNLQPGCPRGRHCGATGVPPNCLGGREGTATGWREHRWGGKGRQVPRHRCVAERRDCATTSNNTGGGGRCPPRSFVPTGGRESAATAESAAGRGQQRDGDNGTGTTAGRQGGVPRRWPHSHAGSVPTAALWVFPRRQHRGSPPQPRPQPNAAALLTAGYRRSEPPRTATAGGTGARRGAGSEHRGSRVAPAPLPAASPRCPSAPPALRPVTHLPPRTAARGAALRRRPAAPRPPSPPPPPH